jgi:sialidase-1
MTTRRQLLAQAPAFFVLAGRASAEPRAHIESIEVITQQPEYYHGWPTLARRADGQLLAVYSGGRERHVCPFGRVEIMRSRDDGRSWSWPQVLMDTPIDDRDAGILVTPKGTILVTTFTSLAYENSLKKTSDWPAERLERWQAFQRGTTEAERQSLLGTWMLRSTDGGLTWSAPYRVPLNSPHGPVLLSDGRLLYAGKRLVGMDSDECGVCESSDDGLTWRWLARIPLRAGDKMDGYHELHAVETADHRILVQIRNHNSVNPSETLQCESSDGGKTWSEPRAIGVWGLPSHLLRLGDGRLLMTYGYRREPFGNQARWSEDHGRTWSQPLTISGDGKSGDLGYPSTVELAPGRFATLWYEYLTTSPKAVLRLARWSLA